MQVDLSRMPAGVCQEMARLERTGRERELLKAIEEQKRAAAFHHQHEARWVEGIGAKTMVMHPFLDVLFREQFGAEYDYDPAVKRWIAKKEEAYRVKSRSPHIRITVPELPVSVRTSRFRKQYDARPVQ